MGNQASKGDLDALIPTLNESLLHTTNSSKVLAKIEDLVKSGDIPVAALLKNYRINVLQNFARLHGLPLPLSGVLEILVKDGTYLNKRGKYKICLALKYAIEHNPDFISLTNLLNILFSAFPLSNEVDFVTEEIISQLMLCITKVLNPDRIKNEGVDECLLWKLENYLGHVRKKYKPIVLRSLGKMGYLSENYSRNPRSNIKSKVGGNVINGQNIICAMQMKKELNVSAHVMKTQQTEAIVTEEISSEKSQMASISLTNALEHGRARTMDAARAREVLPKTKAATGSDRWWFKTTSWEVTNFLQKARGDGAISPVDVKYLLDKITGFKMSFTQSDYKIVKMIAETFYLISKYQKLDHNLVVQLLYISLSKKLKSESARLHFLQAVDRHCNREGRVPSDINNILLDFLYSPEVDSVREDVRLLISDILLNDASNVEQTFKVGIEMLNRGKDYKRYLDLIQRQLNVKENKSEIQNQPNLIPCLIGALLKQNDHSISEKILEVLEDFLMLPWTQGLQPGDLSIMVQVASNGNSSEGMQRRSLRCVLMSMEKGLDNEDYFQQFSINQLRAQFGFLFNIISSENKDSLRILTIVMLSKVLENPTVMPLVEIIKVKEIISIRKLLLRNDVLKKESDGLTWSFVPEENLTDKFDEDMPLNETFEFVSNFAAKLLLLIFHGNGAIVTDEMTISCVSQSLISSKGKMTRILCAEFLFRCVTHISTLYFSQPILSRIQGQVFSPVGDIRAYITAAYSTSLSNQAWEGIIRLESEHVNFLVHIYHLEGTVHLGKENLSPWINPKILDVFYHASQTCVEISEQVLHLLAWILGNTCADNYEVKEYHTIKIVLEIITLVFKDSSASPPTSLLEGIENLLLESDIFVMDCADILQIFMLNGLWVDDTVLEEFAKYLWREPSISIPMLEKLAVASENQELPEDIFRRFQMELLGLRLCPLDMFPEKDDILTYLHLPAGSGDALEILRCITKYVEEGMQLSQLNLGIMQKLLENWELKYKSLLIYILSCAASNCQSLPRDLIELSLPRDIVDVIRLEFATNVIRRGQQIPENFLDTVFRKLTGKYNPQRERDKKMLQLVTTMILHNHRLPSQVLYNYCKTIYEHISSFMCVDNLSSLIRLIEGKEIKEESYLNICKEIFLMALKTNNPVLAKAGEKGLISLPEPLLDPSLKAEISVSLEPKQSLSTPSRENLLLEIKNDIKISPLNLEEKWNWVWMEQLRKYCCCARFLSRIENILTEQVGSLSPIEEMLIESICNILISEKLSKKSHLTCRRILEHLVKVRKYELRKACQLSLSFLKGENGRWAWGLCHSERGSKANDVIEISQLIVQSHRAKTQQEITNEEMYSLENELINGEDLISPVTLEAYFLTLVSLKTTARWKECACALAEYLKLNLGNLDWRDKFHILNILHHLANHTEALPEDVLQLIIEGASNPQDPLLRGLCITTLLSLRGREVQLKKEMDDFYGNFHKTYEKVWKTVEEKELSYNSFLVLQTLSFLDLKGMQKKEKADWMEHLMTADTILQLATDMGEELELYHIAKYFSSKLKFFPILRLLIINAIRDYLREKSGVMSPARILQFVNLNLKIDSVEPWDPEWIKGVICSGFADILQRQISDCSKVAVEIVIKQWVEVSLPNPLEILGIIVTLIEKKEKLELEEVKGLLRFIEKNYTNEMGHHLNEIVQTEVSLTLRELLASLQTGILQRLLNVEETLPAIGYAKGLLLKEFKFSQLTTLFEKIRDTVERKGVSAKVAWNVLENVLYQILTYSIKPDMLSLIVANLKVKKVSEWIDVVNNLIMEQLHSTSQETKKADVIAKEFLKDNELEDVLNYMEEFAEFTKRIEEGNIYSCIKKNHLEICQWQQQHIKAWAGKRRGRIELTSEVVVEALAVISRACFLKMNYNLTSIQIISVFATLLRRKQKGVLLQVATGSGKSTIIAALAVIIKKFIGCPVDIYTSSPVLAERDAKCWGEFYKLFGLSCAHNCDKGSGYFKGAKSCYRKDIVYGDTSQFQFDALRDEYSGLGTRAGREYGFAIVDEVDSMFVDDSSKLARLSSSLGGMDILQIIYHLIWHRLFDIQQRLVGVGDQIYYLEGKRSMDKNGVLHYTFFDIETKREKTFQNVHYFILQNQACKKRLEKAFIFEVHEIDGFVTDHLTKFTKALIGEFEFKENGKNIQMLKLPEHLKQFAKSQVGNWVDSALTAMAFKENVHYVVDNNQIKPVDYQSTGIIQSSTNWNNGLHQFLQVKHKVRVTSETVTTNLLSNMAMFQKYGSELVGFTGTLGSEFGKNMLKKVYGVETLLIPELYYKRFRLLGNRVEKTREAWAKTIAQSATQESAKGRAVLVICQTIDDAEMIASVLEIGGTRGAVKLYTRNNVSQEKHVQQVYSGDIIVATNLAGRGTDINTRNVEASGGLHVILAFLPDSLRVEEQAFGRTARQGNKGTGEIIMIGERDDFKELKTLRDKMEGSRLEKFENEELRLIRRKDQLFLRFCKTYSKIREEFKDHLKESLGLISLTEDKRIRLEGIEQLWAMFLKQLDDGELKGDGEIEYNVFESEILAVYKDVWRTLALCKNCFYWIRLGNYYYKGNDNAIAQKYFQKGIDADQDFASGGFAGLAFCILKRNAKWLGENSHEKSYKIEAIENLRKAIKTLYAEIGLHTVAQTLLQQRGDNIETELFKQLTEKVNLVGEYAKNLEGAVTIVERSLRRVYVTKSYSNDLKEKRWQLEDGNPKVTGNSSQNNKFSLEFHDLTFRDDNGRQDQAEKTVNAWSNVCIQLENQNLSQIAKCGRKSMQVRLNGLAGFAGATKVLNGLEVKGGFVIGVGVEKKEFLFEVIKRIDSRKACIAWSVRERLQVVRRKRLLSTEVAKMIELPGAIDCEIEIDFKSVEDMQEMREVLEEIPNLYIVLSLNFKQIENAWISLKGADEKQQEAGILQSFSINTVHFEKMKHKEAKELISFLRDNNIPFVLYLKGMILQEAKEALKNSGRKEEEIEQKGLKEMGSQFSSTSYIPLEAIRELAGRGLVLMPEFAEKAFVPWRSVISVGILAAVQVAAGGLLICTGFGATVGMGLLTEGFADLTTAYRVYSTRQFSWQDYAIQKAISLTISAVSMGLNSLKDGAKGVHTLVQGAAQEGLERGAQEMITGAAKKTLNQTIKLSGQNLRTLAIKQIGVQGCETVARIGLNSVVDTVTNFTFESVKEHLTREVETTLARELREAEFIQLLGLAVAMDHRRVFMAKINGWVNEVTNPQSGNWNKAWDGIGYPLITGILADPKYLGSTFSMTTRLIGIINGCKEITTVVGNVCQHIKEKLNSECKSLTPSYAIQEAFGVSSTDADNMLRGAESLKGSLFHLRFASSSDHKVEASQLQQLFDKIHKAIVEFTAENEQTSRIIKSVADRLASHITHVANKQLIAPVTTAAVGKIVAKISQEIQSNFLVNENHLSKDQKKCLELKKKDPEELSQEEKAFLLKNDLPLTITEQIKENAKDYNIAYQKRDIIAAIATISEAEKGNQEIPEEFSKEALDALTNILGGGPANMTDIFLLAELNGTEVKLVDDVMYKPSEQDKESGVKLIIWEKPEEGQQVGHYKLMDTKTGTILDFKDDGTLNCAYNVMSYITGKSPDALRFQSARFIACNQEKFGRICEGTEWLKSRYPQDANELLHVGGLKNSQIVTEETFPLDKTISTDTDDEGEDDFISQRYRPEQYHDKARNLYLPNDKKKRAEYMGKAAEAMNEKVFEKNSEPIRRKYTEGTRQRKKLEGEKRMDTIVASVDKSGNVVVSGNVKERKDMTNKHKKYGEYGLNKGMHEEAIKQALKEKAPALRAHDVDVIGNTDKPQTRVENAKIHAEMQQIHYGVEGENTVMGASKAPCTKCDEVLQSHGITEVGHPEGSQNQKPKNWELPPQDPNNNSAVESKFKIPQEKIIVHKSWVNKSNDTFTEHVKANARSAARIRVNASLSSMIESIAEHHDRPGGASVEGPTASSGSYEGRCTKGIYTRASCFDAEAHYGVAQVRVNGPAAGAGIHSSYFPDTDIPMNVSAYASAEVCRAEASVAGVNVGVGLNFNTGASIGIDGASASFLGFGVSIGPTVAVRTPIADASCVVM